MIAYYESDGSLIEVAASDNEDNCFGLLRGEDGCSNLSNLQENEFELSAAYPWIGFHGLRNGNSITSLGLIVYDTLSVKCKPYSD